jgi:N-acetylglucosaminyldiphosphoundecaprenol N-acetyl-beta-D-mannosaminyltransferase
MGNPLQELFLFRNRNALRVPLCIGVGGIFHQWAGDLARAPDWVRAWGMEWVQILVQQPEKWRRYLLGNPAFLARAIRSIPRDRERPARLREETHADL